MASPEAERILQDCNNPDSGCFRDDPEALDYLLGNTSDTDTHKNHLLIAGAAAEAGAHRMPLESAQYQPFGPHRTESQNISGLENSTDKAGRVNFRIARCAYVCGQKALADCPLGFRRSQ
jgi:hypothetical protein